MGVRQRINDAISGLLVLEHRVDPWVRPAIDPVLKGPVVWLAQALINAGREDLHLGVAEERVLPGEMEATAEIIGAMSAFTRRTYASHLPALRAGNTKTYGAVRGVFQVRSDLPARLRHGVFAQERTYPAWVRFSGPGPLAPPDIKDAGIMSIGVKLMGVPGAKFLDDEQCTQDFTGITAPTFTTPNVIENLRLQRHIGNGTPAFYFLGPWHSHLRDAMMQGAYAKTQSSPLQEQYFSCTPCLLGEGQAIQYSLKPVRACAGARRAISLTTTFKQPWRKPCVATTSSSTSSSRSRPTPTPCPSKTPRCFGLFGVLREWRWPSWSSPAKSLTRPRKCFSPRTSPITRGIRWPPTALSATKTAPGGRSTWSSRGCATR